MKNKIIGFFFVILIVTLGCEKKRPLNQKKIWDCHQKQSWNENKINNELIGKWVWTYTESYWAPDDGRNTTDENIIVDFMRDSILNIYFNGELENTTKWHIVHEDGNSFGIEQDSVVTQLLYGRILYCGDIVEFNDSYIDGSDNYFERVGE